MPTLQKMANAWLDAAQSERDRLANVKASPGPLTTQERAQFEQVTKRLRDTYAERASVSMIVDQSTLFSADGFEQAEGVVGL